MAQENRAQLKTYFESGDIPTEAQYINLLDSILTLLDSDTLSMSRMVESASGKILTPGERSKLVNLVENYKGNHATLAALNIAHPSASAGDFAIVNSPLSIYLWDGAAWSVAAAQGSLFTDTSITTDRIVLGANNADKTKESVVSINGSGDISTPGLVDGRDPSVDGPALDAILATGDTLVSTAQAAKINNFRGYYADLTALTTAVPTGVAGDYALVEDTDSLYYWKSIASAWTKIT